MQPGHGQDPRSTRDARSSVDTNAEMLAWYVATIDVTPPGDLAERTLARVRQEPRRTPPGRLLAAFASLSPSRIASAFRRNLEAAAGRVSVAPVVRAQAIALVAVLVLSVGALGTAGAFLVRQTLDRQPAPPTVAAPSPTPSPSPSPTPTPTPTTRPTPTRAPVILRATPPPTPTFAPPTTAPILPVGPQGPTGTAAPIGTERPVTQPTERPRPTPRADKTQKPHPTAKPDKTKKPRPTKKPDKTQKPRPTRKPDRTFKPGTGPAQTPRGNGNGNSDL
jgi:hypothetical protein